jgi:hypothetical protein
LQIAETFGKLALEYWDPNKNALISPQIRLFFKYYSLVGESLRGYFDTHCKNLLLKIHQQSA